MNQELLERIDEVVTRFELDWKPSWTTEDLHLFLRSCPLAVAGIAKKEVLLAEISKRWQAYSNAVDLWYDKNQDSEEKPVLPLSAECYATQFKLSPADTEEILLQESASRAIFGELPYMGSMEIERLSAIENLDLPTVSIFHQNQLSFSGVFCGPLLIGRQSKADSEPYSISVDEQNQKLIVSHSSDASVSRNQAKLEFINHNVICVQNISRNRSFGIMENGPQKQKIVLGPGESSLAKLPVLIVLGQKIEIARQTI